jgi:hypothetical protein
MHLHSSWRGIAYKVPNGLQETDILRLGVRSFSHLVKFNEVITFSELAKRIEAQYDAFNPKTRLTILVLDKADALARRSSHSSQVHI